MKHAGVLTATGETIFPGVWMGEVLEVDDDQSRQPDGRIKVKIPDVYGDNAETEKIPWAYPIFPGFVSQQAAAFFAIPPKKANVCILFERGDPQSPRWFGGWTKNGRLPYNCVNYQGRKYPNIQLWRGEDGMMIRFIAGELLEINLGSSGEFQDGIFVKDDKHKEHDTFIRMDKKRGKFEIRSKYPIDIRSKGKITFQGTSFRFRAMPNQQYDQGSETWSNESGSVSPKIELSAFDPEAKQGARITMEPGKLQGQAKKVKGFKDK